MEEFMATIACPACTKQVSPRAPACPGCGEPISQQDNIAQSGDSLTTIQGTSKSLKTQQVISLLVLGLGILGLFSNFNWDQPDQSGAYTSLWAYVASAGLAGYLITKLRVWWHHQ